MFSEKNTLETANQLTPLVSVVIPCHNCEKWISRAVNSVLAQSYPSIEILLIENNSTDNTVAVLEKFASEYPQRIRVYVETKKGACAARNLGLEKAEGEWIQFLDADDELLPPKIQSQMNLVKNNSADIVVDDYHKIMSIKVNDTNEKITKRDIIANNDPWLGLINSRLGITSANLFKKESLLKVGGWNEELSSSQEYNMMFRLLQNKPTVLINHQVHTIIHSQTDSVSRTQNDERLFRVFVNRYTLRCKIYEFLKQNRTLNNKYKQSLYSYLYYHLLQISELNLPFFKEQVKNYNFKELGVANKMKIFIDFLRHSIRRKYGHSNILLKGGEFQYFFFKYLYLLKY